LLKTIIQANRDGMHNVASNWRHITNRMRERTACIPIKDAMARSNLCTRLPTLHSNC
jgi:hypothetical protein